MARKSRKNNMAIQMGISTPPETTKVYSTALYARISVETERKRESDSIGNQIQMLKDFVSEKSDMKVFDVYCDDDISGTDFIRPEFSRMMNDARNGKINCIVVKDLSRLGRNYLESGEYIEMVFPFLNVRFIAINDHVDTLEKPADISVQLRNLANEMYAKDISKKICSTMQSIQQQGKYAGSRAPYGYLIDPMDKHRFVIDPETAPIVKEMFEMVAAGNTFHYVAKVLNERGVPSPGRRIYDLGISTKDKYKKSIWFMPTVRRVLDNPVYLGWMVSGRYRSDFHETGEKGSKPVPKEAWLITRGTHEPIVSESLFDEVQEYILEMKQKSGNVSKYACASKERSVFKGKLRCGECGKAMFLRSKKGHQGQQTWWYYCPMHDNYGSSYCSKKAIKQEELESVILKLIQTQMKLFTDAATIVSDLNKRESGKVRYSVYQDQIKNTQKQIEKYMSLKAGLYQDFADGILSEADYIQISQEYAAKADELRIFLGELKKEEKKYDPKYTGGKNWNQMIEQFKSQTQLDEQMVSAFIKRITLYNNGHIEVQYNFCDELEETLYFASIRRKEVERYAG